MAHLAAERGLYGLPFMASGKIEPYGVALRSIRGFGYRLELVAGAA